MDRKTAESPIKIHRALAGFGLIAAIGMAFQIPDGPAVHRDLTLQVDPNTIPPQVLNVLPSLGPVKVKAIVEARERAPFQSIEDLDRRVKGIGPATAQALKPFFRFPSAKP